MSEERTLEDMAQEVISDLGRSEGYASGLIGLIRAVVRDELRQASIRAEAEQKLAVQSMWDGPEFQSQVRQLAEGRRGTMAVDPSRAQQCANCGYQRMRPDGTCSWCAYQRPAT